MSPVQDIIDEILAYAPNSANWAHHLNIFEDTQNFTDSIKNAYVYQIVN
jgi:hypothetical protein